MKTRYSPLWLVTAGAAILTAVGMAAAAPLKFTWSTVVNNNDVMPGAPSMRTFNSYNQPSVNAYGLVVMRARSRGGDGSGPATHGIYTRDMSIDGNPIVRILDRSTTVPQPNNLGTLFVETPSFPRIDMWSHTIASRGNHQPVWRYFLPDGTETRAGTTGIYTNPFGDLIAGVDNLGNVDDFDVFEVPEFPGIRFEVFPGAPSVTEGDTIVFKGNYTVNDIGKTGAYYRVLSQRPIVLSDGTELAPAGGDSPVVLIANNTESVIPGTDQVFGSVSPPTAVGHHVVFTGFDDEENPTLGGLYLAPLAEKPLLIPLVGIGERVPGGSVRDTFNKLGEGVAFDGRYVGFWGAWGTRSKTVRLYCPTEGNRDRIDYCNQTLTCVDTGETIGDPNSVCDETGCYQDKHVSVNQGVFVRDTVAGKTWTVAKTGPRFDEFLFWNYSGKTPCVGGGNSEEGDDDDGELVRWRSAAFVALSGEPDTVNSDVYTAFKAASGDVIGIYLGKTPGQSVFTVLDNTMNGQRLDPEAPVGSIITELGIEREGLRGDWLAISAKMAVEGDSEEEDEDMAGVYLTKLRP